MARKRKHDGFLRFLYNTAAGRLMLKPLVSRGVSRICGKFLESKLSKPLIKSFIKKNNIDLEEYESDNFRCFNDCFSRKIKDGRRPIDPDENTLISPCDAFLSAYRITDETVLPIKQSQYTVSSLLNNNNELAAHYKDGICLVFRLCVHHYHRYHYPVTGDKGENIFIKGKLHTVRPIALEARPVFVQNCREYTVIDTQLFGKVLQMEVGAMLVGKIKNHHGACHVIRGEEKGMFLYGGSTIVLLLEKGACDVRNEYFEATEKNIETPVRMGEALGISLRADKLE